MGLSAFNGLFWGSWEAERAGTEVGAGVWASKTVLKIRYKSFSESSRISVAAARVTAIGGFGAESPASCLENSDLGDREESRRAMERRFGREQLRPYTTIILALIFF